MRDSLREIATSGNSGGGRCRDPRHDRRRGFAAAQNSHAGAAQSLANASKKLVAMIPDMEGPKGVDGPQHPCQRRKLAIAMTRMWELEAIPDPWARGNAACGRCHRPPKSAATWTFTLPSLRPWTKAPDMTAGMSARELVEEELIHGALRREQLWRMIGLGGGGLWRSSAALRLRGRCPDGRDAAAGRRAL